MRLLSLSLAPLTALAAVNFDREIRPILSDNCFACHGPDEKQRQAGLRLDTKDGGIDRIVVPGKAAESRLYQRISHEKPALRMPPPAFERALTPAQIARIKQWIEEGATWERHWSFVSPQRPEPPPVRNAAWVRNPIDRFILARLEREGLKPSPEADRATLLRRLSFDLTGLPPTPEELNGFLADKSRDAYEKQVDRLLHSPRHGERMAMLWLDLARYADTHGYHIDSHRDMWPWRDWVISAFNRNLPFDEFTIEQLAGDLLPNPRRDQRVATGFNRNHMINFEGGAIPEEYLTEYVVDRVETTATAWMGLTMGCARCHDHKYDPIPQKDFYRFFAFFNTLPEKGLDGRAGNAEPILPLPDRLEEQKLREVEQEILAREKDLADKHVAPLQAEWERRAALPEPPRKALVAHYELDGNLNDASGNYLHARVPRGEVTFSAGPVARAGEFDGETEILFPALEAGRRFTLAAWVRLSGKKEMPVLRLGGVGLLADEAVAIGDLKLGSHLIVGVMGAAWRSRERIPLGEWYHVAVSRDGGNLTLYVDGKQRETELFAGAMKTVTPYKGRLDDVRLYARTLNESEIRQLAVDEPARATLALAPAKRSKEQKERLREYFLLHQAAEPERTLYAELTTLRSARRHLEKLIPSVMVMQEAKKPRQSHVLGRGDYRNLGETVTPGAPSFLPPLPKDAPQNRLGLARWLVDPAHPLTARVAVNRYWQMYFGHGIVKTTEDFGAQGELPVHPELLDWLATEFIRGGWDIRAMQRLIVTSATYRQSSRVTPELLEKDPENRLLARGPRFRLPAEMVRDNALTISGLLNGDIGGPSVFPYQPRGLWEEMAYGDVYSAQTYVQSHGRDLYRRSLYTFWKRTVPPASFATFDAPDREKCAARRPTTNTPLQALVLMNDPTYLDAAQALAQRTLREAARDTDRRLRFVFRLATAREPQPKELAVLRQAARQLLARFAGDQGSAARLVRAGESAYDAKLDTGELAAWTTVASIILNLDETITKE